MDPGLRKKKNTSILCEWLRGISPHGDWGLRPVTRRQNWGPGWDLEGPCSVMVKIMDSGGRQLEFKSQFTV